MSKQKRAPATGPSAAELPPAPSNWRLEGFNHLARAHALGAFKVTVGFRLTEEMADWLWRTAWSVGLTRPAFLGFLLEEIRPMVDAGTLDIRTKLLECAPRYRREVLGEAPESVEERAIAAVNKLPQGLQWRI